GISIPVGGSETWTASYAVDQAMIDSGADIANTASFDPAEADAQSDDATTTISQTPGFSIVKDVDTATLSAPGTLTYTITVANTGNVTLTEGALSDSLPVDFGGAAVSGISIPVGGSETWTASYAVDQAMIDSGADIANTASFDPAEADAQSDDATTTISQTPGFSIEKTVDQEVVTEAGTVSYTITVTNTGNTSLVNGVLTDNLPVVFDGDAPEREAVSIPVGGSVTWTATYAITQEMIDAGEDIVNTATFAPAGLEPQSAVAVVGVAASSSFSIVKDVDTSALSAPGTLTYTITVTNTGSTTLTGGTLTDSLPVVFSGSSPALTGVSIPVGGSAVWTASHAVDQAMIDAGADIVNTASFAATGVSPQSDDAVTTVTAAPQFTISKVADDDEVDVTGQMLGYTITVANTGNVGLTSPVLTDVLIQQSTSGDIPLSLTSGPTLASGDADSDGVFDAGETWIYQATVEVTAEMRERGRLSIVNTASFDTAETGPQSDDAVTAVIIDQTNPAEQPDYTIEKTSLRVNVRQGELVPWRIEVTNNNLTTTRTIRVVDRLPAGFVFQDGSATVNGSAVTPSVTGSHVTFSGVVIAPGATATIELSSLVTGGVKPGTYTNFANIVRPFQQASANVTVQAEPVFDCGTVIGKVFDDRNQDGYQNKGETGIAGARVVTLRGELITTDQHGRFHVPCADLPRDIGSNYALKLDTRSLPSGYRLTTENPRVVRLTAGKMTEVNFGVSITRVVRILVADNAFVPGSNAPKDDFVKAISRTVAAILDTPSAVRITYQMAGESRAVARQRMTAVEKVLRNYWRGNGRYKLVVEKTMK
ncbi:COG1470 family protein, partial [Tabrizicola oligotrophica]